MSEIRELGMELNNIDEHEFKEMIKKLVDNSP